MSAAEPSAPSVRLVCCPAASRNEAAPGSPHVLLVVDQLSRTLGGGERVLLRQAELLPSMGFRVSVLTLALDPESPVLRGEPPCPIYLLALEKTYDLRALRAALVLRKFLLAEDVRLVQTFFESSDLWVGSVAKTIGGMALIWSRRDLGILRGRKHRVAYRLLCRMPDLVFAVSEQVRQHVLAKDRVPPERVVTVYNGVEVPREIPVRELEPQVLHVAALGNVRPVKGFDVLVEAAGLLLQRHPGVRFSIAGSVLDEDYAATLQQRVEALGIAGQVRFLGNVTDVPGYLRMADLFVLPSRSEGFSSAILEAMAAGLPVVATEVGGNAEAIRDEDSGLLVRPDDAVALAAALQRLVVDGALRRRLGVAAFAEAQRRFSTAAMVEKTAKRYRQLLAKLG